MVSKASRPEKVLSQEKSTSALRQSEDRFRAAFQASPDAVCLISIADNRLLDINQSFSALTGHSREEAIGKTAEEINFWQNRDEHEKLRTELLKKGSLLNREARFRDKGGRVKTGLISAMLITRDTKPHILYVIRDIDVLKKTEEALAVSEARFRELFNNMSSGVAVYNVTDNGHIVLLDCNRAAERIEGFSKDTLLTKDIQETLPDFRHSALAEVLRRVWETGNSEHHPVARYQNDTLVSWKEYYIYKLPSGEIIAAFDDVTKRKIADLKLLEYQEQLRSLASELSLAEEQERHNIAIGLHDQIGQTLSVLNMKLHSLRESITASDCAKQVDAIQEGLKQVIADTRSLTFELRPPILYELGLEAALEWLGEQFHRQQGLAWQFEDDGRPKPLGKDVKIVLFRSVRELLINIVKHARTDTVRVGVCRMNGTIRIEVQDQGIGFDLHETNSRTDNNYGFGLFNIRERLRHLGGNLDIDTRPGHGTRITIMAPLKP